MKQDFGEYIKSLGTEKFRSIIVHHDSFRALEQFAQSAVEKCGGRYCDLLAYFKDNSDISVDVFDVLKLEILLKNVSFGQPFLYVDKVNFLLDTWSGKEKTSFYGLIKNVWNSFYQDTKATLIFFIQTYDELEQLNIVDSHDKSRVHSLSSFKAIE